MVEVLTLEPPTGRHFTKLPADMALKNDYATFTAHWSEANGRYSVRREFTSRIDQPLCTGKIRDAMAQMLPKIAESFPTQIAVATN